MKRPPGWSSWTAPQRGQAPRTRSSRRSSRARLTAMTMPATTKVGTRMKWATGMNTEARARPQNMPSPARVRANRWPGACSTITASAGRGGCPNAVSDAGTSVSPAMPPC